jgi:hypothetical protein
MSRGKLFEKSFPLDPLQKLLKGVWGNAAMQVEKGRIFLENEGIGQALEEILVKWAGCR